MATEPGGDAAIAVVVGHNMAPAEPISPTIVLGMFARKRLFWVDHSAVVPVNLTASHVFTGLGSNTPTTAPICLRYIHPLVNGANLYRSPLICTATVRLAERCRVIIFY